MSKTSWLFLFAALSGLWAFVQLISKAAGWFPKMTQIGWIAVAIGISLVLSVIGFYRSLGLVPAFDADYKPTPVNDQTFVNSEVIVDGKSFNKCTFQNVTFVFKGQRTFQIVSCIFSGSVSLRTDDPIGSGTMALARGIGMLQTTKPVGDTWRNVEPPKFGRPDVSSTP